MAAHTWTVHRFLFLIAGTFVALSVLLGLLVSHWWFAFTAFVGLNMAQSAITGWCPMVSILRLLGVHDCACPHGCSCEREGRHS